MRAARAAAAMPVPPAPMPQTIRSIRISALDDDDDDDQDREGDADQAERDRGHVAQRGVAAPRDRLVDLAVADHAEEDEGDGERREGDAEHDERPPPAVRELRRDRPGADADSEAGQPTAPPGEVGALVRQTGPAAGVNGRLVHSLPRAVGARG